jgi:hypothetical protein
MAEIPGTPRLTLRIEGTDGVKPQSVIDQPITISNPASSLRVGSLHALEQAMKFLKPALREALKARADPIQRL